MFGEKKLDVYEDHRSMGITLKWFTPVAIFLLFFSIFWDGFLIFWYSMAFSDGMWIMTLFPLLHVAVGLGLTYYTICLFFNKTFIDVDGQYLSVAHKPLPWWGNKHFEVRDIVQLYVWEKVTSGKNGPSYTYELRAKMKGGDEKAVLSLGQVSSQDVLRIEEHLEKFLGITDMPVKGEYGKTRDSSAIEEPRRQGRIFSDPALSAAYFAKEGDSLHLKNEALEIASVTQFDWTDGNSDKSFQLINPEGNERLFFLEQNKALLLAFHERELNLFETGMTQFQKDNPPKSIKVEGVEYLPTHIKTGKCFVAGNPGSMEVSQWSYSSKDKQGFIRIVSFGNSITLFKGEKAQAPDLGDALDLGNLPQRDAETNTREWRDEDLV